MFSVAWVESPIGVVATVYQWCGLERSDLASLSLSFYSVTKKYLTHMVILRIKDNVYQAAHCLTHSSRPSAASQGLLCFSANQKQHTQKLLIPFYTKQSKLKLSQHETWPQPARESHHLLWWDIPISNRKGRGALILRRHKIPSAVGDGSLWNTWPLPYAPLVLVRFPGEKADWVEGMTAGVGWYKQTPITSLSPQESLQP